MSHANAPLTPTARPALAQAVVDRGARLIARRTGKRGARRIVAVSLDHR